VSQLHTTQSLFRDQVYCRHPPIDAPGHCNRLWTGRGTVRRPAGDVHSMHAGSHLELGVVPLVSPPSSTSLAQYLSTGSPSRSPPSWLPRSSLIFTCTDGPVSLASNLHHRRLASGTQVVRIVIPGCCLSLILHRVSRNKLKDDDEAGRLPNVTMWTVHITCAVCCRCVPVRPVLWAGEAWRDPGVSRGQLDMWLPSLYVRRNLQQQLATVTLEGCRRPGGGKSTCRFHLWTSAGTPNNC
jgi:hypothetical protein